MAYCGPCQREFGSEDALTRHLRAATTHRYDYCSQCDRFFSAGWNALSSHYANSSVHDWCSLCSKEFPNRPQLIQHRLDSHPSCSPCNLSFVNQTGLEEHYRQSPVHSHLYCVPCKKLFPTTANIDAHLNSSIHVQKTFKCPGRGCTRYHVSHSAVILHLESGSCPSGITRHLIDRYVSQNDTNSIITDPRRLIASPNEPPPPPPTPYIASERAWNGDAYECYFCHSRDFRRLEDLNKHLASPRHHEGTRLYRCPNATCGVKLTTLSGLVQHVERGSCGVKRFAGVQQTIESITSGFGGLRLGYN
ncbi:hypothetical protein BDY24DRAFT_387736 [Mrakia frigida]|uniref:uncharacterized protein n=1 Tax=Mrakia frigida TaxID=29902 RepID=UPI003FCBF6D0